MLTKFVNSKSLNCEYKDKIVLIRSEGDSIKEISFVFPVRQILVFEGKILIRIEPELGKILNENVFCYTANGEYLWQIQKTHTLDKDCPYTNIVTKGKELYLYNLDGEKILIDSNTGKILKKEFLK